MAAGRRVACPTQAWVVTVADGDVEVKYCVQYRSEERGGKLPVAMAHVQHRGDMCGHGGGIGL